MSWVHSESSCPQAFLLCHSSKTTDIKALPGVILDRPSLTYFLFAEAPYTLLWWREGTTDWGNPQGLGESGCHPLQPQTTLPAPIWVWERREQAGPASCCLDSMLSWS